MDYEYMALSLANLSGIPVRLYKKETFLGLFHSNKFKPDLAILEEKNIFRNQANVSYYMSAEFLFYGLVRVPKDDICMVLGPISQLPPDKVRARNILLSIGESPLRTTELLNYLHAIPGYPLRNFLQILCTITYILNGEKLSVGDVLPGEIEIPMEVSQDEWKNLSEESSIGHNTYELEKQLLANIEHGRPDELKRMFRRPAGGRAGKMAQDILRQQKNLLIVTATLESRAAIKGGLDIEKALTLSDMYIQKAELMNDYEALSKLVVQMSLDFAERVSLLRLGESHPRVVREARNYILQHIDERITTAGLAKALHINRSYLCTCFKAGIGSSVNEYIIKVKIEEAGRLLKLTQKPLKEIAEHLGFSSQSYFQNVFKKVTGITPLEYRLANKQY